MQLNSTVRLQKSGLQLSGIIELVEAPASKMAGSQVISILLTVALTSLVLGFSFAELTRAQTINLRHPESNNAAQDRKDASRPVGQGSRFKARPGNVIVHFDRSHDIQQLQYVLSDGRLATLYQRSAHHPDNSRPPVQVPAGSNGELATNLLYRREENTGAIQPIGIPHVDHEQTIDILNSKLNAVSQLIGDHVTIDLPNQSIQVAPQGQTAPSGGEAAPSQRATVASTIADVAEAPHRLSNADKLDVIATVAADALQVGAHAGLKKAGALLGKLRGKVSQKLRDLPEIVEAKLRAKSSAGQVFLDNAREKVLFVTDEDELNEAGNAGQQQKLAASAALDRPARQPSQPIVPIHIPLQSPLIHRYPAAPINLQQAAAELSKQQLTN